MIANFIMLLILYRYRKKIAKRKNSKMMGTITHIKRDSNVTGDVFNIYNYEGIKFGR